MTTNTEDEKMGNILNQTHHWHYTLGFVVLCLGTFFF